jgi:hypothetical protein
MIACNGPASAVSHKFPFTLLPSRHNLDGVLAMIAEKASIGALEVISHVFKAAPLQFLGCPVYHASRCRLILCLMFGLRWIFTVQIFEMYGVLCTK